MPVFSASPSEGNVAYCLLFGFRFIPHFLFCSAHSLNSQRNEQRQVIKANRVDLVTIQLNFNTPEE